MDDFDFLRLYVDGLPDDRRKYFNLLPGLDASEVASMAAQAGITVPDELKALYTFSYGAELDEYHILTVPQIVETLEDLRDVYDYQPPGEGILPFAYLHGSGDYVALDLARKNSVGYAVLDGFHEHAPEEWKVICFGVRNWLRQMAEHGFKSFWLGSG
jgi:hypothetical protein